MATASQCSQRGQPLYMKKLCQDMTADMNVSNKGRLALATTSKGFDLSLNEDQKAQA